MNNERPDIDNGNRPYDIQCATPNSWCAMPNMDYGLTVRHVAYTCQWKEWLWHDTSVIQTCESLYLVWRWILIHCVTSFNNYCMSYYHCYHIFPWSCVWDVCCIIFCHVLHIHSFRENWGCVLIIIVQSMMSANSRIRYGLQMVFVFFCTLHHLIIIIVQTYL